MDIPRVTIVTPSYNQAAFLEQTIQSVLDQGYPDLEYMIVDGGSTDGSVEIIRKYADRLTWWVSEKDHGQAEAINKGFSRASGELVGWLNSDDVYQPGSIQAAVNAFRANPQAGLVYGDVLSVDAANHALNLMKFAQYSLEDLMSFTIISQPGVMMRRAVLEKSGTLDIQFHYMLDHHLWLRMARLAPMVYLARRQAAARFHPGAKNLSQAPGFGLEALRVAAWLQAQPEFAASFNRHKVWGGAYRVNGWYLVEGGQPGAALRSYGHSLLYDPAAALKDWKRMVYAALALLGFTGLKASFYDLRQKIRRHTQPDIYADQPGGQSKK
jgi:glycosyltransferase involved in cell wall biosynthesis